MSTIDHYLAEGAVPVVAILRGLTPGMAVAIGRVLVDAGIRMIEVPLNSPDPFASISALQRSFGQDALIGAGTVLDCRSVALLADTGARLMVTPNSNPDVIAAGVAHGLEVMPGFSTPTEAFVAIGAGARKLKLFPASTQSPAYLKAIREVLDINVGLWAVGGTGADNLAQWHAAGAEGIGVGSALYRAGDMPATVSAKAWALVEAWHKIVASRPAS